MTKEISLLGIWNFELFFTEQIRLFPERKMLGVFSGIFKYRVTAKAEWKDLRDLKPHGEKRMRLLSSSLL